MINLWPKKELENEINRSLPDLRMLYNIITLTL